jgi:DNA adenine methylase
MRHWAKNGPVSDELDRYNIVMSKPILKWAGGKRAIVPELIAHMPADYGDYWEPFVGGAALFLALFPIEGKLAHLSDLNEDLMTVYRTVRKKRFHLMRRLDELNEDWSEEAYYAIREAHRAQADPKNYVERAARFMYLNKYSYNGLVRYNSRGEFNTPWGHKKNQVPLYNYDDLQAADFAFTRADLKTRSYDKIKPAPGDFVYFDPPYHSTFTGYQKNGFGEDAQRKLADFCRRLDAQGVYFLASNSATPFIEELYAGFHVDYINAPRYVSCRSDGRKPAREVLVSNYEPIERRTEPGSES